MTALRPAHGVLAPLTQRASPNRSSRRGSSITHLVWHSSAGSFAGGVSWLCTPTILNRDGSVKSGPDASCHLFLNEKGSAVAQLVHLAEKAWHASGWNAFTIGVEHASLGRGFSSDAQLVESARVFAWLCHRYGIPPLDGLHRPRGIVRHRSLGAAGGGHSDGPTDSVWRDYLDLVGDELQRGGFRKTWAK